MFWSPKPVDAQESGKLRNQLDSIEMSKAAIYEASILNILNEGLGYRKSLENDVCLLGDERVIPMMSYGLIEYLMGLDLSACDVLELGGGHSTEFWSQRTKSVCTFETDTDWARMLGARDFPNTEIRTTTADRIAVDMTALARMFDVIVVDASANRYHCAKTALTLLKPGGFILLDNSDWYPNTTALLRAADLIQVDFHDFRPMRWYRCATSIFLHKDFRPRPRYGRLPLPLIGGKDIAAVNEWDQITE